MKERPILFSAPMIRAILDGKKTQTRRLVNLDRLRVRLAGTVRSDLDEHLPKALHVRADAGVYNATIYDAGAISIGVGAKRLGVKPGEFDLICPYADGSTKIYQARWTIDVAAGQRLWVRETWRTFGERPLSECTTPQDVQFAAGCNETQLAIHKWRPSIFMPRWASRITLEVTDVRVERLNDISEDDARAEGVSTSDIPAIINGKRGTVHTFGPDAHRKSFAMLWNTINEKRAPWNENPWVWAIAFSVVSRET